MQLTAFVEPHPPGFRAFTGPPLDLTADGPTADAAVDALRPLVAARNGDGDPLRTLLLHDHAVIGLAWKLGQSPDLADFLEGLQEFRREHNTVPDPDA